MFWFGVGVDVVKDVIVIVCAGVTCVALVVLLVVEVLMALALLWLW